MGQPVESVFYVVTKNLVGVVKPGGGFGGVARNYRRRQVQIERGDALTLDPTAVRDKAIMDDHRHAGYPRHLLH